MIGQKSIKSFFSPAGRKRDAGDLSASEQLCDVSKHNYVAILLNYKHGRQLKHSQYLIRALKLFFFTLLNVHHVVCL